MNPDTQIVSQQSVITNMLKDKGISNLVFSDYTVVFIIDALTFQIDYDDLVHLRLVKDDLTTELISVGEECSHVEMLTMIGLACDIAYVESAFKEIIDNQHSPKRG